jgi:hypothetical protein
MNLSFHPQVLVAHRTYPMDFLKNPFIYGFLDKMKERETGSDVDKRLGMLEDIKSELDHYQDNNSEQGLNNNIMSVIRKKGDFVLI